MHKIPVPFFPFLVLVSSTRTQKSSLGAKGTVEGLPHNSISGTISRNRTWKACKRCSSNRTSRFRRYPPRFKFYQPYLIDLCWFYWRSLRIFGHIPVQTRTHTHIHTHNTPTRTQIDMGFVISYHHFVTLQELWFSRWNCLITNTIYQSIFGKKINTQNFVFMV